MGLPTQCSLRRKAGLLGMRQQVGIELRAGTRRPNDGPNGLTQEGSACHPATLRFAIESSHLDLRQVPDEYIHDINAISRGSGHSDHAASGSSASARTMSITSAIRAHAPSSKSEPSS